MKNSIYKQYKNDLKQFAKELSFSDKPARRMALNDYLDIISRDLNVDAMKGRATDKQAALYYKWLESLTCELHERNIK